ncbi:MAG: hypothetical protein EXX96DRAFT_540845 [Benjaminiella poitrasii]|nr:MAG: hypothetical protein EXX96DRAFT_540845 [Benjaminiella poitrasii]
MKCLREQRLILRLPNIKYIYSVLLVNIGLGEPQTPIHMVPRIQFDEFVWEVNDNALPNLPVYRTENFRTINYTSILTQTIKMIKRHVARNFELNNSYLFSRRMYNHNYVFYVYEQKRFCKFYFQVRIYNERLSIPK